MPDEWASDFVVMTLIATAAATSPFALLPPLSPVDARVEVVGIASRVRLVFAFES